MQWEEGGRRVGALRQRSVVAIRTRPGCSSLSVLVFVGVQQAPAALSPPGGAVGVEPEPGTPIFLPWCSRRPFCVCQ